MSLRVSLLRCGRLLQQSHRTQIVRPHLLQNIIGRRPFHACPPLREVHSGPSSSDSPNSTSAEPSSSTEQPESITETAEPAVKAEETAPTSKPDIPPPPPKRAIDPKDHELAELKDKYLRSVADFRNLQSQTRREVASAQAYTIQRFSTDLLDTIDTLTTALETPPPPPLETQDPNHREDVLVVEHRNLYEGLRMIERILLRTLENHGLMVIPTKGEALPVLHEVAKEVEGDEKDIGTIADVVKKGYTLNGKVIRPAQVVIFKAKTPAATEEKSES